MSVEKEQLLCNPYTPEDLEQENMSHEVRSGKQSKKHGIWCRILTTLHLKRRSSEHEKLLSESQVHLSVPADAHIDANQKNANTTNKSKSKSKKQPKNGSKSKPNSNSNINNNVSASKYETLDNDFGFSCERLCHTEVEKVPDADNQEGREYFDHITVIRNVHEYGDDRFGECQIDRPEDDLIEKPRAGSQTTGQYIKHQWHGKRAKKARKRIRRAMRTTWLSLQTGTSINHMMPNANNVTTAVYYSRR